ncbi:MAG: L-rhamnose mutarotase [Actinobacteria bacterium]|nr:L-rhamnose mutarotase [Actinomycetota bacterium]
MIRKAFMMRLQPGGLAMYKKYHDEVWPELVAEIQRQGIAKITIFESDPILFMYSEINDLESWNRLWRSDIHAKWGEIMNPYMEFNSAGLVDAKEVREIFHLQTKA